jgi:hypothetical protein
MGFPASTCLSVQSHPLSVIIGVWSGPSVNQWKGERVPDLRSTTEGLGDPPEGYPGTIRNEQRARFVPAVVMPTGFEFGRAEHLPLVRPAVSAEAVALVDDVMAHIAEHLSAGRTRQRRQGGEAKVRRAVGIVLGGLLYRWASDDPRLAFRSLSKASFTGAPVSFTQFKAATDALTGAGLVGRSRSLSYEAEGFQAGDPKTSVRKARRYWPTDALLALAAQHGLSPDNVRKAFPRVPPTKPPVVKQPVELRTLGARWNDPRAGQTIRIAPEDATACAIRAEVEAHNTFAARCAVTGCCPPRWRRRFLGGWTLHGRWYAAGEGAYQTMPERERITDLRMNGEPVAEIDVKACHLSIVAALSGSPLSPDIDPYDVPGIPRPVVKRWLVATLGKGSPVVRVPDGAERVFAEHHPKDVMAAVVAKHLMLMDPAALVPPALVEWHGDARRVLPHWLAGIEAEALTDAMRTLRDVHGVLALPMHDGLIVPCGAAAFARSALTGAFERLAGFTPGLEVQQTG